MKPPAENIERRKLVSVPLDNATLEDDGDWVGVVTTWKMPGALEGIATSDLLRVQKRISEDKWRENSRATAWVGKAIADVLNLDIREPAVKKRIMGMIKIWLETGALKIVEEEDESRHKKEFIEVGEWAV
jgi:hypothetical protein